MSFLTKNIGQLVGSGHPVLDTVAKYYTQGEGKHVRPMLVLLMSRATAIGGQEPSSLAATSQADAAIDVPISPASILSDRNPLSPPPRSSLAETPETDPYILPSQRRLAEITELIHTASLLHDDVLDSSVTRRSLPSANIHFGNKMAILAGDFLLGRASVALARLHNPQVTELLATVIANLVEGEFMQLRNTAHDEEKPAFTDDTISYYLQKTYLKSASLISKSCRAAALLGPRGVEKEVVDAAYAYGKNLGLAFQLVDDLLDYTGTESSLGKPAGADLQLGLATAPLLFAWRERADADDDVVGGLVGRRFAGEGDVETVRFDLSPFR
jgi:hexaprenyl-diphosphate synthase